MKKILAFLMLIFMITSIDVSAITPRRDQRSRIDYYRSKKYKNMRHKKSSKAIKKMCKHKYFYNSAFGKRF